MRGTRATIFQLAASSSGRDRYQDGVCQAEGVRFGVTGSTGKHPMYHGVSFCVHTPCIDHSPYSARPLASLKLSPKLPSVLSIHGGIGTYFYCDCNV